MPKKTEAVTIKYPQLSVWVCSTPEKTGVAEEAARAIEKFFLKTSPGLVRYRAPLGEKDAEEILGWEEEVEGGPKFKDFVLKDRNGVKVRFNNNTRNRPFYQSNYNAILQDVLNKRWEFNGETVIVGVTGAVIDAQHTLAALKAANQEVRRNPAKWKHLWPDGVVTIDKIVVFGVSEDDRVINTVNTAKPRSLADVIYRCGLFGRMPKTALVAAARVLDYAVRALWVRTGVHRDGQTPQRTHSEAIDFIDRHRSLLKFVRLLVTPKTGGGEDAASAPASQYVPLGYAAAMMYLMAASATPYSDYYGDEVRSEKSIDWSNREAAEAFWGGLASDPRLAALRDEFAVLHSDPAGWGRLEVKDSMLCAAWNAFSAGDSITRDTLSVSYSKPDVNGARHVVEAPVAARTVGDRYLGIDKGTRTASRADDEKHAVAARKEEVDNDRGGPSETPDTGSGLPARVRKKYKAVDVFVCRTSGGTYWYFWGPDAEKAGPVLGKEPRPFPGGDRGVQLRDAELVPAVRRLNKAGVSVGKATEDGGEWFVEVFPSGEED